MLIRVPPRFRSASIKNVDAGQFKAVCAYGKSVDTLTKQGVGLWLTGVAGLGKSYALAALTAEAKAVSEKKKRYFDFEWVLAQEMMERLPAFASADDAFSKRMSTVKWLVIDDLGAEYRGGGLREQVIYKISALLRKRSQHMLVTHVSTNLSTAEIKEVYGAPVASLIKECFSVVTVKGKDRRELT
jgi:DNA replication protein DnaC